MRNILRPYLHAVYQRCSQMIRLKTLFLQINRFHLFSLCHHRDETISRSTFLLPLCGLRPFPSYLRCTLLSSHISISLILTFRQSLLLTLLESWIRINLTSELLLLSLPLSQICFFNLFTNINHCLIQVLINHLIFHNQLYWLCLCILLYYRICLLFLFYPFCHC